MIHRSKMGSGATDNRTDREFSHIVKHINRKDLLIDRKTRQTDRCAKS